MPAPPAPAPTLASVLARQHHDAERDHRFLGELSLARARVHEFCGNARRTLAMVAAGSLTGPVFWITPGWLPERLNPEAMLQFANPGRFTFVTPSRPEDLLWCMEEILRSGRVALAVADIPAPAHLTPVRRLHLAAETGATEGALAPLGLLLTPGNGGAQGVESRWRMDAAHEAQASGWRLTRLRARTAPVKSWRVLAGKTGPSLAPAPPAEIETGTGHGTGPGNSAAAATGAETATSPPAPGPAPTTA